MGLWVLSPTCVCTPAPTPISVTSPWTLGSWCFNRADKLPGVLEMFAEYIAGAHVILNQTK